MGIYLTAYLVLLSFSFIEFFDESIKNKYLQLSLFSVMVIYLIILTSTRFEVGTDFHSYMRIFEHIDSFENFTAYSNLEPGFKLITVFFRTLNFSGYFLFFVFTAITFVFLGRGIQKSSPKPFFSLFLFFAIFLISYVFNVMRQGLVMAIFIYSLEAIKEKEFTKVLMVSMLATLIHSTGFLILASYFLYHFTFKQKTYFGLMLASVVYYLNANRFYSLITMILPGVIRAELDKYMRVFPESVSMTSFLLRLIIVGLFIFFYDMMKKEPGFRGLFNIYFFGFLAYTLLSFQSMGATRLNMFFRVLEIILFPYLIGIYKQKPEKIILFSGAVLIASAILLMSLSSPDNFPFQFFWQAQ